MDTKHANETLSQNEIQHVISMSAQILGVVQDLPTKGDVKAAVLEGIQDHERACDARAAIPGMQKQVGENTGVVNVIRERSMRSSIAPAAAAIGKLPAWAKVLIPAVMTAIMAALGYSAQ